MGMLLFTCALALLIWVLVFGNELQQRRPQWHWYLVGYPLTALRVVFTWRRVAYLNGLTVSHKPNRRVLGDLEIKGEPLRTRTPRLSFPRATPYGLEMRVRLHAGQTPAPFLA